MMILKLRSPNSKLEADSDASSNKKSSSSSSVNYVVGLRILTQISQEGKTSDNYVVVKPAAALKISLPNSRKQHQYDHQRQSGGGRSPADQPCFLKSCHLCNNNLSLDKEVYMYRGDQGFCSIECRNRQMVMDEMRELELSTKQMLASYRHCSAASGRRETRLILEDLRRRNKSTHNQNQHKHQNHWAIVS